MTNNSVENAPSGAEGGASAAKQSAVARFIAATEMDTRMLGMIGALVLIWIVFHFFSDGIFLTPRNLWNLSVQSASISVMATGMVLVIVTRNIDLSVGSVLGFVGMVMAVLQAEILPHIGFIGFDNPFTWLIVILAGIAVGAAIGGLQGFIIAYMGVPAFIVTLGGLLVWRGAAWWVTSGRTVAQLDSNFLLLGGGPAGSVGETASWILGLAACAAIIFMIVNSRRQRQRFKFPLRPVWAETFLATLGCVLVLGAVWVANSYIWPIGIVRRHIEANNLQIDASELIIGHGVAIPVLVAIIVGIVMTFIATRTRFGRYVFAMGGNPEATDLAGINTRWVTMKIFIIMGMLCAIAAAISTARLNAATNAQGTLDELMTIAAAVIGGTSLSGGVGTIAGAMIGAVVMQSLTSGMVLMQLPTPVQAIVVGIVLVIAVWLDQLYRRSQR